MKLFSDISAALSVSFLSIATGAAFGIYTGLGADIGILSMAVGALGGWIFGGEKVKAIGPTAPTSGVLIAVLSAFGASKIPPEYLIFSLLGASVIMFILSFFSLQKLLKYIPYVVVAVFVNGVSLLLITSQLKKIWTFQDLPTISFTWEILIVIGTILLLITWKKINRYIAHTPGVQILSGPLLAMAIGVSLVYFLNIPVQTLSVAPLSFESLHFGVESFHAIDISVLILSAMKIAIVLIFVTIITTRALSSSSPFYQKELRNQASSNALIALIGGIPTTIGLIRTKALENNGAKTEISGIILALLIIFIIQFASPVLSFIPTSVFIGILIYAGFSTFDTQVLKDYLNHKGSRIIALLFVIFGSISMLFFDLIIAIGVSLLTWKILSLLPVTKEKCYDIKECPCVG